MIKRSIFKSKALPYLLITPQVLVTLTFFYWPAAQGLLQSVMLSDPFGRRSRFVWLDNFSAIFSDALYLKSIAITLVFSLAVALTALSVGLFIASLANRALRAKALIRTLLIWPYAVAPAISGILSQTPFRHRLEPRARRHGRFHHGGAGQLLETDQL
jgi:sn-glycerol 3-phosphate transport system permease protein